MTDRLRALRRRSLVAATALLGLLLLSRVTGAFGTGHDSHGSGVTEQLLLHVAVVEAGEPAESAVAALRSADTAKEVADGLDAALEKDAVALLGVEDQATAYNVPVTVRLPDGSAVRVRPLDRQHHRRLRTLVTVRTGEDEEESRVVEIPLNRTTALPTGGIVLPLDGGERLLTIRVEVRH